MSTIIKPLKDDLILTSIYSSINNKINKRIDEIKKLFVVDNSFTLDFSQRNEEIQFIRNIIDEEFFRMASPRYYIENEDTL